MANWPNVNNESHMVAMIPLPFTKRVSAGSVCNELASIAVIKEVLFAIMKKCMNNCIKIAVTFTSTCNLHGKADLVF